MIRDLLFYSSVIIRCTILFYCFFNNKAKKEKKQALVQRQFCAFIKFINLEFLANFSREFYNSRNLEFPRIPYKLVNSSQFSFDFAVGILLECGRIFIASFATLICAFCGAFSA